MSDWLPVGVVSQARGVVSLDLNVYVIGVVAPLITTILALLVKGDAILDFLLAGMSAIGGTIGGYLFLALGSDGDITEPVGTTITPIVSATLNTFTWQFVVMLPLMFAFLAFMGAIYRAYKGFK